MEAQEDDEILSYILFFIIISHNKNVINGKKATNVKCNCRNKSIHLSSSELWPLMGYSYLNTSSFECVWLTGRYHSLKSCTMFVGPFLEIWKCLCHPGPCHAFRISYSAETVKRWIPSNVFVGWLGLMCVTRTWVPPSWSEVILIWYHYIVICTLVKIFNWWFRSKEMKLRVLMYW